MVKEPGKSVTWKTQLPDQMRLLLEDRERFSIFLLSVFYAVGIVGFVANIHPDFVMLTPFQLLLAFGLLLWTHPKWNLATIIFMFLCFGMGFGAEVFGVQTGLLFGTYEYNAVLGYQLWDTPVMIGVNWILVAYSAGMLLNALRPDWHWLLKSVIAAALMVVLDFFIEPVAIAFGFWTWTETSVPPLQNYLGWFWVALPVMMLFFLLVKKQHNKVGTALFIIQFLFFFIIGRTI